VSSNANLPEVGCPNFLRILGDRFHPALATLGIRLRPNSALIELRGRLFNRTPLTQTFLWWANVAARVHDQYQSFFPPDVTCVADHAVRAMTSFPIARRTSKRNEKQSCKLCSIWRNPYCRRSKNSRPPPAGWLFHQSSFFGTITLAGSGGKEIGNVEKVDICGTGKCPQCPLLSWRNRDTNYAGFVSLHLHRDLFAASNL